MKINKIVRKRFINIIMQKYNMTKKYKNIKENNIYKKITVIGHLKNIVVLIEMNLIDQP